MCSDNINKIDNNEEMKTILAEEGHHLVYFTETDRIWKKLLKEDQNPLLWKQGSWLTRTNQEKDKTVSNETKEELCAPGWMIKL